MPFSLKRFKLHEIAELAKQIEEVYSTYNIRIPDSSLLHRYIRAPRELAAWWDKHERAGDTSLQLTEETMECLRIGSAISWLKDKPKLGKHLKRLIKGSIDPTSRVSNQARNYFFEVNMVEVLESTGVRAEFAEPPDIHLDVSGTTLSMACKCVYSQANLGKSLKDARNQIIRSGLPGIVALSIDAIAKAPSLMRVRDESVLRTALPTKLSEFHKRHELLFAKKLDRRSVLALILSLTTLTMIEDEGLPSFGQYMAIANLKSEKSPYTTIVRSLYGTLQDRSL